MVPKSAIVLQLVVHQLWSAVQSKSVVVPPSPADQLVQSDVQVALPQAGRCHQRPPENVEVVAVLLQ